jgi:hypothetical protein
VNFFGYQIADLVYDCNYYDEDPDWLVDGSDQPASLDLFLRKFIVNSLRAPLNECYLQMH